MTIPGSLFFNEEGATYRLRYYRFIARFEEADVIAEAKGWLDTMLGPMEIDEGMASIESGEAPEDARESAPGSFGFGGGGALDTTVARLAFHAPVALIEGAWLQGVNHPAISHRQPGCDVFAAYLALLGDDAGRSPAHAYRGLLAQRGLTLANVSSRRFSEDSRAGDAAFAWGALQLALGLAGPERFEEILGFSIGYATSSSPWRLCGLAGIERQCILERYADLVCKARDGHLSDHPVVRRENGLTRLQRGLALYRKGEAAYLTRMREARMEPGLEAEVAAIMARKASIAAGYHKEKTLGGCPLDRWFAAEPFDANGFLAAFAQSGWVSGESGQRPFDRLTGFGGPMFGVFTAGELASIESWLASGASASICSGAPAVTIPKGHGDSREPVGNGVAPVSMTRRELFHRLVNSTADLPTTLAARQMVDFELRRAGRGLSRRGAKAPGYFDYSPDDFVARIHALHRHAARRQTPFSGTPRMKREEYVWALRQFAPAVLVDGCWLARAGWAAKQDSPVHRRLLSIFADELGAGDATRHHPAIYRALLNDVQCTVPELASIQFALSPVFVDAAFDLPVFCLAIGQNSERYLPEILGLNLAIELSGLGAEYGRLADELAFWGIDPLIVRLHQSIDNLASGHAALAVEAIRIYLDDIEADLGRVAVESAWRRIWCGYLSLRSVTRPFKRALMIDFCKTFWSPRLRDLWGRIWHHGRARPATL